MKAWIPVDIAKALAANPSLVQKAVETFYTRDAIQLRVCSLVLPPAVLHSVVVCAQNVPLPASYVSIEAHQIDEDSVCATGRTKILPTKDIWTLARKGRD